MNNIITKLSLLILLLLFPFLVFANDVPKASIKANGQLVYNLDHKKVDNFLDMFKEGNFYGRLRNNNFYFAYSVDDSSNDTHFISGTGASLVYKSASFHSLDFTLGLYGSYAYFENNDDPINAIKPGKDVLSRHNYVNGGSKSMAVLGQANLNYKLSKTNFMLGRQLFETFYTKSNDTKMIPNTFDGFTLSSKDLPSTTIKAAYLVEQKLRDHTESHSILMFGDANSSSSVRPEWSENDDAGMHKGLTYTNLLDPSKGGIKRTDAPLIVLDAQNDSVKNLKINFSSYMVPELLSQAMGELNYKIAFKGFSITPGVRYIKQFDNGAGAVGGASVKGDVNAANSGGYTDPTSLESQMIAARLVAKMDDYRINLGYTNILDEGDLVTPWRGFPTAGYTRSMGMYNWKANTKSYRLELVKGANKSGVYKDIFIQTSILYIDGDDLKSSTADILFYYAGFIQDVSFVPGLQYRLRLGYNDFIGESSTVSGYLDSRFELNYLF